MPQELHN